LLDSILELKESEHTESVAGAKFSQSFGVEQNEGIVRKRQLLLLQSIVLSSHAARERSAGESACERLAALCQTTVETF
jgi:hypothetical protein